MAQDTETSPVWPSMSAGFDQDLPLKVMARPPLSTATQKTKLTQETDVIPLLPTVEELVVGSMAWGGDQVEPFQARTFPTLSAATQNEVSAHETVSSWPEVSTSAGWDQSWPFHSEVPPAVAMQKVELMQEMELGPPQAFTADDHCPL